jgi:hypothetical protein
MVPVSQTTAIARLGGATALVTGFVLAAGGMMPAHADTVIGGSVGYFALKAEDGRANDDVLVRNLDFLSFDVDDFNNAAVGGEFLLGLGNFVEAGVGVGFYQRTVPTVYTDFVDVDGSEIEQDLKLRVMPVTFSARVFPIGREAAVQPYLGGGLAILAWRYSESGEFIDFDAGRQLFRETFVDEGNETAPVVFGGVRFAATENFLVGGEFRWHGGDTALDPDQGFAGDRLDLGGYTMQATFHVRF